MDLKTVAKDTLVQTTVGVSIGTLIDHLFPNTKVTTPASAAVTSLEVLGQLAANVFLLRNMFNVKEYRENKASVVTDIPLLISLFSSQVNLRKKIVALTSYVRNLGVETVELALEEPNHQVSSAVQVESK